MPLQFLPELRALDSRKNLVRIPHECDVPLTDRVRQLLDAPEMRRLARISQLGLVALVYPGACHSRLEHSLGVYRNALMYVKQLAADERFAAIVRPEDGETFIAAALLHDLGHWPYCHAIEDMALPGVPTHELFANSFLLEGEIADTLRDDWNVQPRDVTALLSEKPRDTRQRILKSMLSGPIDIDKMDYLVRDSLHAGVPYGRNFDQQRLIGSFCLNEAGDGLAINHKGRTAAEMMVFSRYVMFSEVYWHHAVRAGTAMLQRAFYLLHKELDLDQLFRQPEQAFVQQLLDAAGASMDRGAVHGTNVVCSSKKELDLGIDPSPVREAASGYSTPAGELLSGLFGSTRRLYKRLVEFSHFQERQWYERIARQPYSWLVEASEAFAAAASRQIGRRIAPHEILFDAPPARREVEFHVEVFFPKENVYRTLAEVSPAVHTLATRQFDDYVKRVRIFVHPAIAAELSKVGSIEGLMDETLASVSAA
ncbi:MAG: HD domain-containing protein [Planctomycetia bacterium]|nr:HD domain-containing protein [Planctomycetia bacterium]